MVLLILRYPAHGLASFKALTDQFEMDAHQAVWLVLHPIATDVAIMQVEPGVFFKTHRIKVTYLALLHAE